MWSWKFPCWHLHVNKTINEWCDDGIWRSYLHVSLKKYKEFSILTVRSITQLEYEELLKSPTCSLHVLYVSDTRKAAEHIFWASPWVWTYGNDWRFPLVWTENYSLVYHMYSLCDACIFYFANIVTSKWVIKFLPIVIRFLQIFVQKLLFVFVAVDADSIALCTWFHAPSNMM